MYSSHLTNFLILLKQSTFPVQFSLFHSNHRVANKVHKTYSNELGMGNTRDVLKCHVSSSLAKGDGTRCLSYKKHRVSSPLASEDGHIYAQKDNNDIQN